MSIYSREFYQGIIGIDFSHYMFKLEIGNDHYSAGIPRQTISLAELPPVSGNTDASLHHSKRDS